MKEQRHLRIHGKVQGVGYRFFATRVARRMGLKGWIQNNRDGIGRGARRRREEIHRRVDRGAEGRSALRRSDEDRSGDEGVHRPAARLRREVLMTTEQLHDFIRDVPDFPKPGIIFKDITPLLRSPRGARRARATLLAEPFRDDGVTQSSPASSRAASSSAASSRRTSARASSRSASRASCRGRRAGTSTSSSTAATRWRSTTTR